MKIIFVINKISEMKQTAAVRLGILGLNEDFVQVNEIINFIVLFLFLFLEHLLNIRIYKWQYDF